MKKEPFSAWRFARLPFGDWFYLPRQSLNIVKLSCRNTAPSKPVHISIAITSQCEKNCDFCYAMSGPKGTSSWRMQEIVAIVKSCDQNDVFAVTLGGGEPLLWRDEIAKADFYDLLQELSVFGCDISFTTSSVPAVNWDAVPSSVFPRLSLHYPHELTFILDEIKQAYDKWGRAPGINLLVRKGELRRILDISEKLAKAGIVDILLLPLRPMGRAIASPLIPSQEELHQLMQAFPLQCVKLSSCYHLEKQKDTYLGCGARDWFVSLDEQKCVRACSFSKKGNPIELLEYRDILKKLHHAPILPCCKVIKVTK